MKKKYLNSKKGLPSEIKKTIVIILVIVILIVGMYFLTTKILAKDNEKDTKVIENAIQYNEILAGESFNKTGEYYVIYYDKSDVYSTIGSLISSYQLNNGTIKLYSVDLSNAMNKKYVVNNEDGDIITDDASSLRVKSNTLIKVKDGEVEEVITDSNEIMSILNG